MKEHNILFSTKIVIDDQEFRVEVPCADFNEFYKKYLDLEMKIKSELFAGIIRYLNNK